MERNEAIEQIQQLVGTDLRPLAERLGVTIWRDGKKNKGWAGHTVERYLGLPINSSRSPNFGSWELKVVPLKRLRNHALQVKETMAITMIDPVEVMAKPFAESHLFNKLRKIVVVSRIAETDDESASCVQAVGQFDLDHPQIYAQVEADYEAVREVLRTRGFSALSGRLGALVQPRTKGEGHGSSSRAFYARTQFVAHILTLSPWTGLTVIQSDPREPLADES